VAIPSRRHPGGIGPRRLNADPELRSTTPNDTRVVDLTDAQNARRQIETTPWSRSWRSTQFLVRLFW
jgi:hypothetical protein